MTFMVNVLRHLKLKKPKYTVLSFMWYSLVEIVISSLVGI